ncbi:hypothetical protein JQC92_11320 [Shewanella sp. 202IG2-18]|uniref:hypothetical protein n=1 Tax=Parashewanella hymeniacidonis TaxID=2807618 RepID=UPI00195F6DC1|nr:hypothetical protein [Parashewanella hymeniacidonis]MBM7072610.1 hypothetical protein [Parashewanella hymeniacidonis]
MNKRILLFLPVISLTSGICYASQPSNSTSAQAALNVNGICKLVKDPNHYGEYTCTVSNDVKDSFVNGTVQVDFSNMIEPDTNFGIHNVNFHCHFKNAYPKLGSVSYGFVITSVSGEKHSFNVINDPNTHPQSTSRLVNVPFGTHFHLRHSVTLDTCHVNSTQIDS